MKNFWYYKNYEKLDHYFNTVFAETEKVEQVFEHPNAPVRIVVSNLIHMAARAGIPFNVRMDVNDFGMSDEDISLEINKVVLEKLLKEKNIKAQITYCHQYKEEDETLLASIELAILVLSLHMMPQRSI